MTAHDPRPDRWAVATAPPASGPVSKPPPSSGVPLVELAIPGMRQLTDLRTLLAVGGLPVQRTPADDGRIAAFHAIAEMLRLLQEFKRRIESGEACRLVVEERSSTPGRLVLEIVIRE